MRIFAENGAHSLRNMGDVAMLIAGHARLEARLGRIDLHVVTSDPARLQGYLPGAVPLLSSGISELYRPFNAIGGLWRLMPSCESARSVERRLLISAPRVIRQLASWRMRRRGESLPGINSTLEEIESADAVIAFGGGYITDDFVDHADSVLLTMGIAQRLGKPTYLLGQGLGPIKLESTLELARLVLPRVRLIGVREGLKSLTLLDACGVDPGRVVVTGDDAIPLAYANRENATRAGIGVSLRVSSYSGVTSAVRDCVLRAVSEAAQVLQAPVLPVPISWNDQESDASQVLDTCTERELVESPYWSIAQAGRCKVVVTGTYHAAVFALSQGCSVVGLYSTEYYRDKFTGLADQFGTGCTVVDLGTVGGDSGALRDVICETAAVAEQRVESLLLAAERQMRAGEALYDRMAADLGVPRAVTSCA